MKNSDFEDIIRWDNSKTMIDILDEKKLETEVLPIYFRHTRYESFVRQLNLYGFKKIRLETFQRFKHRDLENGKSYLFLLIKVIYH